MFRGLCAFGSGTMPGAIADMMILPKMARGGKRD
jgi:hypothetical protein